MGPDILLVVMEGRLKFEDVNNHRADHQTGTKPRGERFGSRDHGRSGQHFKLARPSTTPEIGKRIISPLEMSFSDVFGLLCQIAVESIF